MQYESSNTLARVLGSPLRRKREISLTAKQMADVLLKVKKNDTPAQPDSEAIRFYALNQMMARLVQVFTPNERLPDWAQSIAADYELELVKQHRSMVWYTFLVITREFRHTKNPATVLKKASQGLKDLHPHIHDSHAESTLNTWLPLVPEDTLEQYCRSIEYAFDNGSYGGGYGGKPWGQIARSLGDYFGGKSSAEVFIDTAYTLAHNNGPMFNKNMLYSGYTPNFLTILDVQAAGMVCEGLIEGQYSWLNSVVGVLTLVTQAKAVQEHLGGVGQYVDWYAVEANPKVTAGKYSAYKAKQDKMHPKVAKPTVIGGKAVKIVGQFEVMPGQTVEIFQRMAA